MEQKLFVIDVDHTILNTDFFATQRVGAIRKYKAIGEADVKVAIAEIRDPCGKYTLEQLIGHIVKEQPNATTMTRQILDDIYAMPFADHYYEGVIKAFEKLQKYGRIVIFSQGEDFLQRKKVQPLVNQHLLDPRDIYIYREKLGQTAAFIDHFQNTKKYFFDDHKYYLAQFQHCDPNAVTILIETQERVDDPVSGLFRPTLVAKSFYEAVEKITEVIVDG